MILCHCQLIVSPAVLSDLISICHLTKETKILSNRAHTCFSFVQTNLFDLIPFRGRERKCTTQKITSAKLMFVDFNRSETKLCFPFDALLKPCSEKLI